MKLIDEILSVDERMAVTASTITEAWPMIENGAVNPLVLVELVAQTAGVCIGWTERQKKGNDRDGTGWIVGIKESVFHWDHIPVNHRIITEIKKAFQLDHYSEIMGTTRMGDKIVAEIKLQVVQSDNE